MDYMLIFSETAQEGARRDDPNEAPAYWGAWNAYVQELSASGAVKSGNVLRPPHTATTLRIEGGKRHVQDGPHPDTKEQLAGYFVIDVPDLDVALHWAAKAPCASGGSVQVRPVLPPPPQKAPTSEPTVDIGQKLPTFSLQNQDGAVRTNANYAGKWTVLYVYPKDDTPGCTVQGKAFTATKADFDAANAVVVGLSEDDVASHKAFCNKFSFTIELLADPEKKLLAALGIPQSEWKGTMFWERSTFLVDPHGVVRKKYAKVDPNGHEQTLLADIRALST